MPQRTYKECHADWYRLCSKRLIQQIESTSNPGTVTVSEEEVVESLYFLLDCSMHLRIDSPCFIQFWTSPDPCPEDISIGDNWETSELICLDQGDGLAEAVTIRSPDQGMRRLVIDGTNGQYRSYEAMDAEGPPWFFVQGLGQTIISRVQSCLDRTEVQVNCRVNPRSESIVQIDIQAAVEELKELDRRFSGWL